MKKNVVPALAAARDALRGRRWSEGAGEILVAWRACWDPRLLRILDMIAERACVPDVRAGRGEGTDTAWLARAGSTDPLDVAAVCRVRSTSGVREAWQRANQLLSRPSDPRIARWAVHQLEQHFQSGLVGIWLQLIEKHGDAGTEATLQQTYARPGTQPAVLDAFAPYPAIRATLRARSGTAPAALLAALHDVLGEDPDEQSFLAAIYADPDDMELRAVYADHLTQRGDPRGEFIALGLAATHIEGDASRGPMALWQRHCKEWYAPLAGIANLPASGCKAGFLHHLVAAAPRAGRYASQASPAALTAARGAPCWQTVRSVDLTRAPPGAASMLADPTCRHIQTVHHLTDADYNELRGATLPWLRLDFRGTLNTRPPASDPLFPTLREVTLHGRATALFSRVPLWENVEHLVVQDAGPTDLLTATRWMPRLRTVTAHRPMETLVWTRAPGEDWRFVTGGG